MPQQNEDEEEEEEKEAESGEHIKNEIKQHEIPEKRNKLHVRSITADEIQDEKIKIREGTKTFKRSNVIDARKDERKYSTPRKKNIICVYFIQIYSNAMMPSCSKYIKFDPLESHHDTNDFHDRNDFKRGVRGTDISERKQNDNPGSVDRCMKNVDKNWRIILTATEYCNECDYDGKYVHNFENDETFNITNILEVIYYNDQKGVIADLYVPCDLSKQCEQLNKPFIDSKEYYFLNGICLFHGIIKILMSEIISKLHEKCKYSRNSYFNNIKLLILNFSSINLFLKFSHIINFKEILNFTKNISFIIINSSHFFLIISNYTNFNIILYYTCYCDSDYFSDNLLSNINFNPISATSKYSITSGTMTFFPVFIPLLLINCFYISVFVRIISKPTGKSNQCFKIHPSYPHYLLTCLILYDIHKALVTAFCFFSKQIERNPTSCIIHRIEINWDVSRVCCTLLFPMFVFTKVLTILFSNIMTSNSISISLWKMKRNVFFKQKIELMKYMNLKNNVEISPLFFPPNSSLYSVDRITTPCYCSTLMEFPNITFVPLTPSQIFYLHHSWHYYDDMKHFPYYAQFTTYSSRKNESDYSQVTDEKYSNLDNTVYVTVQEGSAHRYTGNHECVSNAQESKTYRRQCKSYQNFTLIKRVEEKIYTVKCENKIKNTTEENLFQLGKLKKGRRKNELFDSDDHRIGKPFDVQPIKNKHSIQTSTIDQLHRTVNFNTPSKVIKTVRTLMSNLMLFQFLFSMLPIPTFANEMVDIGRLNTTTMVPDPVTSVTTISNASFIPWERNICDDYYGKHQQIVTGRSQDISLNLTHPMFLTTNGIHPGVTYQGKILAFT